MQNETALRRHAALVDDMAQARGVDLQEAAMRGLVDTDEIGDAVLRCTGCSNPEHCAHWLSQQTETAEHSPSYCRNTDLFDTLVEKQK